MTIHDDPTTFEARLGQELSAIVAERPDPAAERTVPAAAAQRRRRRPALAFGAAATAMIAALLASQGGSPAYAVEANNDGSVTIEIKDLTDAAGLEQDLANAGVKADVTYLPEGKVCADGRYQSAHIASPISQSFREDGTGSLKIQPKDFPAGTTLVITSAVGKHSTLSTIGAAKGAVGECTPVTAKTPPLPPLPAGDDAPKPGGPGKVYRDFKEAPEGTKPAQGDGADVMIGGSVRSEVHSGKPEGGAVSSGGAESRADN